MAATLGTLLDALVTGHRTFITSVPDRSLAPLIAAIATDARFIHSPCTREEEAVGLCAGAAFAGRRGVLLTQNSGIGNTINALMSLLDFYDLPLLVLVSMRGGVDERIAAQRPMGRVTEDLLRTCGIDIVSGSDSHAVLSALAADVDSRTAILASPREWATLTAGG